MGQSGFSIPGKFGVCWATFSLFFLAAFVGVAECLTIDVHYRMTSCVIVKAVKDEPINGNFEVNLPICVHRVSLPVASLCRTGTSAAEQVEFTASQTDGVLGSLTLFPVPAALGDLHGN